MRRGRPSHLYDAKATYPDDEDVQGPNPTDHMNNGTAGFSKDMLYALGPKGPRGYPEGLWP